jgi:hypothetical protein
MQAIVAAATAVDAFYAAVQQAVVLPSDLREKWRHGRTARYTQVAEVLRRGFSLKPREVEALRRLLRELYKFRDLAVHPSGKTDTPVVHLELNVGVEWRFATFRAANAEELVTSASRIVWDLTDRNERMNSNTQNYTAALWQRLAEIFPEGHSPGRATLVP